MGGAHRWGIHGTELSQLPKARNSSKEDLLTNTLVVSSNRRVRVHTGFDMAYVDYPTGDESTVAAVWVEASTTQP